MDGKKDTKLKVSVYGFHTDGTKVKRVIEINTDEYKELIDQIFSNLIKPDQNEFYKMITDQITTGSIEIVKIP